MKRFAIPAIIGLAAATPVSAALSGYWDSSKVIHAILGNERVADALRQQPIESIISIENGYQIATQDCQVEVQVSRIAPDRPGPARFSLQIGPGQCS
ncbi:hypothetical protein [Paracoccus onubensis]|uniref:Uncharacterized protein n=1 Tax=Paracoccus onubensis TaxID=1675788 RepID=A0A418T8B3_9RHOB|nr:hypothetical protein [Paracoccus onubensis]RJE89468.1 hypothetical protein D3P04_02235 [Paracoccus onubensis]